jgi:hypothetical protein
MREKVEQEQQQLSRERQDPEESASSKSAAIYDDAFARRAGEIIARAVAAVHRCGKRRYSP